MKGRWKMEKLNLTPEEAAYLIGCSRYTIMELARQKRIPHYRVGNRVMFTQEGLRQWIEDQEKRSAGTCAK